MVLKNLNLLNFKNYSEADLTFDAGVNIFTGLNGQGKTNLLDAIYYLSYCKSYFNPVDTQNIRHEESFFVIKGDFEQSDKEERVYCAVKKGQKKIVKRNKITYERLADHIGLFPVVIISPYDKDLISEGSEFRRRFMDSIISQYNRPYLDTLLRYQKVLQQRNTLLRQFWESRQFDRESLNLWDEQLRNLAAVIYRERLAFIQEFNPLFQRNYNRISNKAEEVSLEYRSHLSEGNFQQLLDDNIEADRRKLFTGVGTHKDDLLFSIAGYPLKKFGSQGQQKSYLIALKLAQFDHIASKKGQKPILLLDDIFDKIDDFRVKQLMELVTENRFGQLFITDTHQDRVAAIFEGLNSGARQFFIQNGTAHETTN